MSSKKRRWNDSYLKYRFTKVEKDEIKAQWMECGSICCDASIKPSKLNNHFQSVHDGKETERDMIKKERARFNQKGTLSVPGRTPPKKPILEASYEAFYIIGKTRAPFIGEILIKPATLKITEIILGKEAMKKTKRVPLSNDVVTSRIAEISCNIVDKVVTPVKESSVRISLQLNESTDVSNISHLVVFLRYVAHDSICEEFLLCKALVSTT